MIEALIHSLQGAVCSVKNFILKCRQLLSQLFGLQKTGGVEDEEPLIKESPVETPPGRIYHSTQVRRDDGTIVGIGPGFIGERTYKAAGTGRVYDMNRPPPGNCFNCGGLHWRVDCPYARGNSTV